MINFISRFLLLVVFFLAIPFLLRAQNPNDTLHLILPPMAEAKCGEKKAIPIRVKNFANITTLNFTLKINGNLLNFESLGISNLPGAAPSAQSQGTDIVSFSWSNGNVPVTLADNSVVFEVIFTPKKGGGQITPVTFQTAPTPIVVKNNLNQNVPTKRIDGAISIIDLVSPTVVCPATKIYHVPVSNDTTLFSINASVLDNCGSAQVTNFALSGATVGAGVGDATSTAFKIGTTNVIYTAKDDVGNAAQCAFQVIINRKKDVTIYASSAMANCSDSIVKIDVYATNAKNLGAFQFFTKWDTAGFMYKRFESVNPVLGYSNSAGSSNVGFNILETANGKLEFISPLLGTSISIPDNTKLFTLVLKVRGKAGNYTTTFENVDIQNDNVQNPQPVPVELISAPILIEDKINPTITCPANANVFSTAGGSGLLPVFGLTPVTADNCGIKELKYNLIGATTGVGVGSVDGKLFAPGKTLVSYNVQDFANRVSTCTFEVNVRRLSIALKTDTITCSPSQTYKVRVRAKDFLNVGKLQYSINWDKNKLQYVSASIPVNSISTISTLSTTNALTSGKIITGYTSPTGVTLMDDDVVLEITYNVLLPIVGDIYTITIDDKDAELRNPTLSVPLGSVDMKLYVLDKTAPVITGCPTADIVVTTTNCKEAVTWGAITATDNCSSVTETKNYTSGAFFDANIKPTKVEYTFKDAQNNVALCSFNVIVKETIAPTISCPTDTLKIAVASNSCDATLPTESLAYSDNCLVDSVKTSIAFGTTLAIGLHKVIYTVKDKSANAASCNRYVLVQDKTKPTVTPFIPPLILKINDIGLCGATVDIKKPTVKDNCTPDAAIDILTNPLLGNHFFPVGGDTIRYTVLDASLNVTNYKLYVKIVDGEFPKYKNCPNERRDVTLYITNPTLCGVTYVPEGLKVTDNCIAAEFTVNPTIAPANNFFPVGTTKLTYLAKDNDLVNTATCEFFVHVRDTIRPTITCPAPVVLENSAASCIVNVSSISNPIVEDNCTPIALLNVTKSTQQLTFSTGVYPVTYTVRDTSGNQKSCTTTITIQDKIKPTFINVPADLTVDALQNCSALGQWSEPSATDNCKIDTIFSDKPLGTILSLGENIITYTAKDKSGNTATTSFKVVVKDNDKPKPTTVCPSGFVVVPMDAGLCGATYKMPTFTDNCTPANQLVTDLQGGKPNDFYQPGTYALSLTVKDLSGNSATCGVVITVQDKEAPKATNCPADVTVTATAGSCDVIFSAAKPLPVPIFKDNCDGNITKFDTLNLPLNQKFTSGETQISFVATDASGNKAICSYKVIVLGNLKPTITKCNKDSTLTLPATVCDSSFVLPLPQVNFPCSVFDTAYYTLTGGNSFSTKSKILLKAGNQAIIYTVKDKGGQSATCIFNYTLKEITAPSFITFPKDTIVKLTSADCKVKVTWKLPTVKDNCDPMPQLQSQPFGILPGDEFPTGPTVITYKARDKSGNETEKKFTITVVDEIAPTFNKCPKNIELNADGTIIADPDNQLIVANVTGSCDSLQVFYKPILGKDNCDQILNYQTLPNTLPAKKFPVGTTTKVLWTVSDKSGNSTVCSFDIKINGLKAVKASISEVNLCIGEAAQLNADSIPNATYMWTGPKAFSSMTKKTSVVAASIANKGFYKVKYKIGNCISVADSVLLNIIESPITVKDSFVLEVGKSLTDNITKNDALLTGFTFKITIKQAISSNAGVLILNKDGSFTLDGKTAQAGDYTFTYDLCYDDCPDACAKDKVVKVKIIAAVSNNVTIPTLFSPNADGINDVFELKGLAGKTGAKLVVFNQWGSEVYRTEDYKNDWDGTWKSKDLPDGTYYYIFQLSATSEAQKGYVNIYR